ncbi:MAG: SDR family NAD(P)-dependent oxidoreductase [Anaerolineae bacterium]|jgi:NAD(P)-dependent dehydrogenase (short-subunit alcohol dehydrogenase family)|nr:SDR family NAD(P)-dependent oxidoreductase [Anaerolineae bacterium]MBT7989801.1 SDR family NAD(P)-dependent oxidoreductase [Anaerolineae bacterium]
MSKNWTVNEIPNLTGKIALITGANSGIGYEAAKEFSRKGAHTILATRSVAKGTDTEKRIRAEIPDAKLEPMVLDLASLKSVRAFADTFNATHTRLDLLINNAGIMMVPYGTTEDGFEQQFGTNHLGHFALTGMLIDLLLKTPNARVVNVSSNAHRFADLDFDNLMFDNEEAYTPMKSYGNSKLANLLFTYEMQRLLEAQNANMIAVAAHPGISTTNLANHLAHPFLMKTLTPLFSWMLQDAAMGALPSIRAAVDPNVVGGQYFGPDGRNQQKGYPVVVPSNDASHKTEDARRLWEVSEELTGVSLLNA